MAGSGNIRFMMAVAMLSSVFMLSACGGGKSSGESASDGKLKYEPQVNSVQVMTLTRKNFTRQLVANGKLCARSKASMSFRSSAPVSEILCSNGQRVSKGSVMARQDAEEKHLAVESASLALSKAELDYYDVLAGQGYPAGDTVSVPQNVRKMARMRSGYESALNSLKQARLDYEGTVLKAPFSGVVADLKLHRFDMSGSEPFCTLIDDSVFEVDFTVLESEYFFLHKGLNVKVTPFSAAGKTLSGEIVSINPTVDKHGQVSVRASVRNDGTLVDGMNVKIIVEREVPDMMVVPKSAVVIRDNLEVLFRYDSGKALWTYVKVLMSNSEEHAVIANEDRGAELREGDTVIISGNLNLADGSQVIIKE